MRRRDFILKLTVGSAALVLALCVRLPIAGDGPYLTWSSAAARNGNSGGGSGGSGGGSGSGNSGGHGSEGRSGQGSQGGESGRSAKSSAGSSSEDGDQSGSGLGGLGLSDGNGGSLSSSGSPRATAISIRHANGTIERIVEGRYEMRDSRSRTIVNRRATAADRSRLEGLTR